MISTRSVGKSALCDEPPPAVLPHAATATADTAAAHTAAARFKEPSISQTLLREPSAWGRLATVDTKRRDGTGAGAGQEGLRALRMLCAFLVVLCVVLSGYVAMITSVRRLARRLSTQILVFQALIILTTLTVGLALALNHARVRVDDEYEQRALGVARAAGAIPEIAEAVEQGDRSGVVQRRAEAIRKATGMDFVVVADRRGIRYSHPNAARIGGRLSTDPSEALNGRTVLTVERGTLGRSARAKIPLRAADGRIVGVVSVGILEGALHDEEAGLLGAMALYLGIALVVGLAASLLLARRLKRQTFGLELDQLASLVQEREAMLHGIREGVAIVGPDGRLLLVNDHARRLVDLPGDAVGRRVEEVTPPGRLADLLAGRIEGEDQLLVHGDRLIVANRMPVHPEGRNLGAVVTLRDRTELESLVRELDSVRGLSEAMRAQAHEFSNRLHTLAGLLAMGELEEARRFIAEVADADAALRRALAERVADQRIAALLLAKSVVASERGIELELVEDARLETELVDVREGLTILGNLIDNALDAAAAGERHPPLVRVFIADELGALLVRVRDTGSGVPPADRERVFQPGYSTKDGAGRGVGLSLIRQLVERRGGWVEVDDAKDGHGAVFTAWVPDAVKSVTTLVP
jgi:two-component system CitB family sensor kinase